ncbi:S8 family serine peptidase [Sinosporangium siamense]|uniref:S8 family serine peptidase n=1 Tax=Sinosporangium siamense TaxID=1367973 RepID=UPI001EF3A705|nr:S8 family serine peptidase [Sinosporangium siamense]
MRVDPVQTVKPPENTRRATKATAKATATAANWNIKHINAPRVWTELGTRGENIVVADIDAGVKFDHPALAAQYRGKKPDGSVDHNYNWFNAAGDCPSDDPCDGSGDGTHTMGTMVGDDGAGRVVGVAPGAKWIAARACTGEWNCPESAILQSGEWLLAPRDSAYRNPRPDLAPDTVAAGPPFHRLHRLHVPECRPRRPGARTTSPANSCGVRRRS